MEPTNSELTASGLQKDPTSPSETNSPPLQNVATTTAPRVGWVVRRQLTYLAFLVIIVGGLGFGAYSRFGPQPTCMDRIRNQDESGIDCGGVCDRVCPFEVEDLAVGWSKVFPSGNGTYDVAAFLVNPNAGHGVAALQYRFTLYDAQNKLIAEREGDTFINPDEVLALYEPGIVTGNRVPIRGYVQFQGPNYEIEWRRAETPIRPVLSVSDVAIGAGSVPSLVAQVGNPSAVDALGIQAIAVLFDKDAIPLAVASTYLDQLARGDTVPVTFLWNDSDSIENADEARVYPRSAVRGIAE
ncbi:MAG: hypothetical protein COV10_01785 [Candidatus Vogelbacteria bacterium CG10_big_fil_rev_8_21_14_0_10_51_16]|uniref:Uncharacterized protein n=1 Tax=Candidatus Vogelbacteria bacterium CG10_big_fil_rev_8_21_14_0_10_51_16 TaxID=1975045 RepID=A0A2H0RG44_9BACT|nr:MAG: hypothetical protein COV10_01785 [Candidatus Vogelbacteria bacterium CG10_big_fil_rev_8_21_14_0_10_51_16]